MRHLHHRFLLFAPLFSALLTASCTPRCADGVALVVVDESRTAASRVLVDRVGRTPGIEVVGYAHSLADARAFVRDGSATAICVVAASFAADESGGVALVGRPLAPAPARLRQAVDEALQGLR